MFPRVRAERQSGQGSVEYVGVVVGVGLLLVGLVAVFPSIGEQVTCKLSQAVASITGGSTDCSSGVPDAQGAKDSGNGDPAVATYPTPKPLQPPSPPPPAGVPYYLNPNSNTVKTMQ